MESLLELSIHVDDFCQAFLPHLERHLLRSGAIQRRRERSLSLSEGMTILIHIHQSHYRNFKADYCEHVWPHLRSQFPGLVSYTRFGDFMPSALIPLCAYFQQTCLGDCTGVSFLDSTSLDVCLNPRIASHNVFPGLAARGMTSAGWFFGFRLHLVINDRGELPNVLLTPGNVDDRRPVPKLVCHLLGKVLGDKGYTSKALYEQLLQTFGVQLVTKLRANAKNRLPMPLSDRILLRKPAIVESVIDQLKNIYQIEHSRHRSVGNFLVNPLCRLIVYARQPKKPLFGRDLLVCLPA